MTTPEEIEVNIRQLEEQAAATTSGNNPVTPLLDVVRRMILAGFGAFALTRDEAEQFLNRLVERGEIAQKDAQHLIDETVSKFRQVSVSPVSQAEANVNNLSQQVETGLEQLLNRMNIPSKRDIDELSAKIAQLAARVEELRRVGDTKTTE
ncbi:MAG: poly(hydroxyalkanoate) granule-associated protein [Candidatus Viridilinea halotolerans]|uniref:Poly(Hydroxyalkanoate) granule-associated protein n=1 Tax=Candidatus Viridilinea halotolerans TaxID=2491704 RepID=A0A426TWS3_9CHLR|nr:MAG: poly(hydroxyalkanoate) granule-associated protein [Candidatus Viridilinea halotolerans]